MQETWLRPNAENDETLSTTAGALIETLSARLVDKSMQGLWALVIKENPDSVVIIKGTGSTIQKMGADISIHFREGIPTKAERNLTTFLTVVGELRERLFYCVPPIACASFPEAMLQSMLRIPNAVDIKISRVNGQFEVKGRTTTEETNCAPFLEKAHSLLISEASPVEIYDLSSTENTK